MIIRGKLYSMLADSQSVQAMARLPRAARTATRERPVVNKWVLIRYCRWLIRQSSDIQAQAV